MKKLRSMAFVGSLCLCLSLLFAVAGCGQEPSANASSAGTITVSRVIDGDTIEATLNGKKESIRLIGVDTPETKKPKTAVKFFGPEASAYTTKQLLKKTVRLEYDVERRDKYGRLLAYVWLMDGELFNESLVKEGYARIMTIPPNVKYSDRFVKAQQDARKRNIGIWRDYEHAYD